MQRNWTVLAIILGLTALEIGVATSVRGHPTAVLVALLGLAAANVGVILLFFMHLRWERRMLRLAVLMTLAFPLVYALALITESIWRHLV